MVITKIPGIPLPNVLSPEVQKFAYDEPDTFSAYNTWLQFEQQLTTTAQVRLVRILGYLLLHAPNGDVRNEVAKCIHSCKEQSNLTDIGAFFEVYVITPLKKYRCRTPAPSDHPSRPSFEETKTEMRDMIREAPRNHQSAKAQALLRDNWCCVVTGTLHRDAPEDIIDIILASDDETIIGSTECAHIIPEGTFFNVEPKEDTNTKLDYSASILAILKRFQYDISAFNGEKVHSLMNVITMQKDIHDAFDRLELCFEATSVKDRYRVKSFSRGRIHPHMNDYVIFSTEDPQTLPVPSPGLLALHATCCKVAHLSGSAEFIDSVYHDPEETGVLASDGTSHGFLQYKLLSLANKVGE